MRTTSGRISATRATAASPSSASATTSTPSSASIRTRRPARTRAWSSAMRTRITPRPAWGSTARRFGLGGLDREPGPDPEATRRGGARRSNVPRGPGPAPACPQAVAGGQLLERRRRHAATVVARPGRSRPSPDAVTRPHPGRAGVAHDVGERLLDDAVGGTGDAHRADGASVAPHHERRRDAVGRDGLDQIGQRVEAGRRRERGDVLALPQQVQGRAQLVEGLAAGLAGWRGGPPGPDPGGRRRRGRRSRPGG